MNWLAIDRGESSVTSPIFGSNLPRDYFLSIVL